MKTAARLRAQGRRIEKLNADIRRVVDQMRVGGLALHLEHHRKRARWFLSDGTEVSASTAHCVIACPEIVGCGDSLFGFTRAQTYRVIS
jgi:hypothetical protein